jgi:hypothetical protein
VCVSRQAAEIAKSAAAPRREGIRYKANSVSTRTAKQDPWLFVTANMRNHYVAFSKFQRYYYSDCVSNRGGRRGPRAHPGK